MQQRFFSPRFSQIPNLKNLLIIIAANTTGLIIKDLLTVVITVYSIHFFLVFNRRYQWNFRVFLPKLLMVSKPKINVTYANGKMQYGYRKKQVNLEAILWISKMHQPNWLLDTNWTAKIAGYNQSQHLCMEKSMMIISGIWLLFQPKPFQLTSHTFCQAPGVLLMPWATMLSHLLPQPCIFASTRIMVICSATRGERCMSLPLRLVFSECTCVPRLIVEPELE